MSNLEARTARPQPHEYDPYYHKYVALVPAGDIIAILREQLAGTVEPLRAVPAAAERFAYAPGKWSIREVVGHLSDVERVFGYRALRFARGDATPLAGFDENLYVPAGEFAARPLGALIEELVAVRAATVALLEGLPAAAWSRGGSANGVGVTVRALSVITAGHELHHRALLAERYLAALPAV